VPEREPLFTVDASVLINFLGSGIPDKLVKAFDTKLLVAEQVFREVINDPSKQVKPQLWLEKLQSQNLIEIVTLSTDALSTYLELGSDERLDDGEAATIAVAIHHGAIAVIDEKPARRVYVSRYPHSKLSSTVELFHDLNEQGAMPKDVIQKVLFDSLRISRMRVIPEMVDWVVDIIGVEKAKECSSNSRVSLRRFEVL
jgi:predicted nucleic acid-binding protein